MKRNALILAALFLVVCAALPSSAAAITTTTRVYNGAMGAADSILSPAPITTLVMAGGLFNGGPGPLTVDLPVALVDVVSGVTTLTASVTFVDRGAAAQRVILSLVCDVPNGAGTGFDEYFFPAPPGFVPSPSDGAGIKNLNLITPPAAITCLLPLGTAFAYIEAVLPAINAGLPSGIFSYKVITTNPLP
jgi:hypothetical protein